MSDDSSVVADAEAVEMKRFGLLLAPMVAVGSVFTTAPVTADEPQYWNIYDGPRDSRAGIDIQVSYLGVWHKGYYTVRLNGYDYLRKKLNVAAVYLDTRRRNRGPEYGIQWGLPKDRDGHAWKSVSRVDTFGSSGHRVRCHRLRTSVSYGRDVVRIKVPRSCVGKPKKVRWTGYTGRITRYTKRTIYGYFDELHDLRFPRGFWVGRSQAGGGPPTLSSAHARAKADRTARK